MTKPHPNIICTNISCILFKGTTVLSLTGYHWLGILYLLKTPPVVVRLKASVSANGGTVHIKHPTSLTAKLRKDCKW